MLKGRACLESPSSDAGNAIGYADAFEREMNAPVSTPIIGKPETAKADTKVGRAADDYKDSFWKQMRNKAGIEARNVLQAYFIRVCEFFLRKN